ncbi:ABA4-like family protein [Stratiformator vulcanicus]|uniref:DUF4281 domain-containing protein n=1 Tax=Stratiformator vulcanicus TaxID=2527980 RepID=A0A517QX96_9PLAN|nr:ABA4-like family protein [Stratiformator vulcanicus]QDT36217.1 hypothetical protein Pan189_05720 [Stratiformator vulcanicus]
MLMTPDLVFKIVNAVVLPGWLLLVFAPRWKGTQPIAAFTIPALLGVAYLAIFISQVGRVEGGFDSLEAVENLFTNRFIVVAGWIHYLAFDIFVGSWEVRNSQRIGLSHWFVLPCLLLTFLAGPLGLLIYLVFRVLIIRTRQPELAASPVNDVPA